MGRNRTLSRVWNFNGSYYYLNGTLVNSTLLPSPTRNLDGEFALADQAHIQLLIILDYTPLWAVSSEYFAENASEGAIFGFPLMITCGKHVSGGNESLCRESCIVWV